MSIKKLPSTERPYEKMEMYGAENLSNSELLAIIIKSGTKEKTSVELAKEILSMKTEEQYNMRFLQDISIEEFMCVKGIGKVKAIQLKAVCELAKRMSKPLEISKLKISSSRDVSNLLMDELRFEKKEKLKELILNSKNVLLKVIDISSGGTNETSAEIKNILSEPVKMCAPRIILVHNHPSGIATPSLEDIEITKKVEEAAKIMGIELLDHVIIGDGTYESVLTVIRKSRVIQGRNVK